MDVCILTSLPKDSSLLSSCVDHCSLLGGSVEVLHDKLPNSVNNSTLYISFLGDTIIPKHLITNHMYNTHPGPPWYRGWGSRLRTILDKKATHGATLHKVEEKVDSGKILRVLYFAVDDKDSMHYIHSKAEITCFNLVTWLIDNYLNNNVPTTKVDDWSGTFMTKSEYLRLIRLDIERMKNERTIN